MDLEPDNVGCRPAGQLRSRIQKGDAGAPDGPRSSSVPVGDALIGRVVNALGRTGGRSRVSFTPAESRRNREPSPQRAGRGSRSRVPLQTGLKAVDALVPIGRGQRELIIGDRQTGKTAIALDTIINQKGKDVICIYVAIGQKESTVAGVRQEAAPDTAQWSIPSSSAPTLRKLAPMLYIAPYAGAAMGRVFHVSAASDVLIVYDDLSKQAVAYREISLILQRPPGREAYPGDVFYLHSRLSGAGSASEQGSRRRQHHRTADHRDAGGRYLRLYPDQRYFHHRRSDLPGDGPVPLRCASSHQCWLVCLPCRRRGPAGRDEADGGPACVWTWPSTASWRPLPSLALTWTRRPAETRCIAASG